MLDPTTGRKKIYLHIGYPKTGTTALQNNLFHSIDGIKYIGKFDDGDSAFLFPRAIMDTMICGEEDIAGSYRDLVDSFFFRSDEEKVYLLSDEMIIGSLMTSRKSVYGQYKMASAGAIARTIKKIFPEDRYDLSILIVVRNQADLITSKYAQSYANTYSKISSVSSFSKYVDDILRNEHSIYRRAFDFHYVVSAFSDVIGKERVCVVPFEMLKNDETKYIGKIMQWMGADSGCQPVVALPKENVRQVAESGKHRVRTRNMFHMIRDIRNRFFPKIRSYPKWVKVLLELIAFPGAKGESEIVMTDVQKRRVRAAYKESNQKIDEELGLELAQFGYFDIETGRESPL